MINFKKIAILTVAAFLLVTSFSPLALASDMKIGFVPMTLSNQYFITMVNGAKEKAEELGIELNVQAPRTHASAQNQLRIIENMITRNVDAICLVPSSSEGLVAALGKAQRAGIPIVNLDTRISPQALEDANLNPIPYIGTDNYVGAKKAGEKALEMLNGDGKVAILTGVPGQENTRDRKNGFIDVVEGKLEIVATQTANWEVSEGYNATQNILQANPNLDLIFGSNDGMALGAMRALREAGKMDEVKVIGYDAIPPGLKSVKQGEMDATVAQFPAEMGKKGVMTAKQIVEGSTIAIDMIENTPTKLITQDNIAQMMEYLDPYTDKNLTN